MAAKCSLHENRTEFRSCHALHWWIMLPADTQAAAAREPRGESAASSASVTWQMVMMRAGKRKTATVIQVT